MKIKKINFDKLISDEEASKNEGKLLDESYYKKMRKDYLIDYDCDGYGLDEKGKKQLLFKFRKGVIPSNLTNTAIDSFSKAAKVKKENRGAAAGPLDRKKLPNYVNKLVKPSRFRTYFTKKSDGKKSTRSISNYAKSNIAGYFDYPSNHDTVNGSKFVCRETAFVRCNKQKWNNAQPFIKRVDSVYKNLLKNYYDRQKYRADVTPNYVIRDTSFSTLTMNYSFRTAIHKDKHNINTDEGITVMTVCEDEKNPNKYSGCYLGFPQYGFVLDVRNGDFLAMDNKTGWHGNTEFIKKTKPVGDKTDIQNNWHYNRLAMIFYLRDGIQNCVGSKCRKTKKKQARSRNSGRQSLKK